MFPTGISADMSMITSEAADGLFAESIPKYKFHSDVSFTATLRALLHDRLGQDDKVCLTATNDVTDVESAVDEPDFLQRCFGSIPYRGIFISRIRNFDLIEKFTQFAKDFVLKPDLGLLLERSRVVTMCKVFVSEANQGSVIFTDTLTMRSWHSFQCITPRLLPWYFREKKLTDEEKLLLKSLTRESDQEYLSLLEGFAKRLDLRSVTIRNLVGGLTTRVAEQRIAVLENEIIQLRCDMERLMNQYEERCRQLDERNIMLNGRIAQRNSASGDDELLKFLTSQSWFYPKEQMPNGFSFAVSSFLDQFDPDMFESILNNEYSYLWEDSCFGVCGNKEDYKKFLNALFSNDATMKIRCYAPFAIDLRGGIRTSGFATTQDLRDMMPNPHLYYHSCFGDHRPLIEARIQAGDLIGAVMQCKQSASSLNVGESATMRPFIQALTSTTVKCIRTADGRDVTPAEAVQILKGESQNA